MEEVFSNFVITVISIVVIYLWLKKGKEAQIKMKNYIPLLKEKPHLLNEMLHGKDLEQMRIITSSIASITYSGGHLEGGAIIAVMLKDGSEKYFNLKTEKINNELKVTNITENTNPKKFIQDKLITPIDQLPKKIGKELALGFISLLSFAISLTLVGFISFILFSQGIIDETFIQSEDGIGVILFAFMLYVFIIPRLINKLILKIFGINMAKGKLLEAIIANSTNSTSIRTKLAEFKKIKETKSEEGQITDILAIHKDDSEHWYRVQTEGQGTKAEIISLTQYS